MFNKANQLEATQHPSLVGSQAAVIHLGGVHLAVPILHGVKQAARDFCYAACNIGQNYLGRGIKTECRKGNLSRGFRGGGLYLKEQLASNCWLSIYKVFIIRRNRH